MLEALSVRGVPYQVVCRPHFTVQRLFLLHSQKRGQSPEMHVALRIAAAAALASSASAFVAQVQHASVLAPAAFPDNFSCVRVGACSLVWDPHRMLELCSAPSERTPIGLQQEWLHGLRPCRGFLELCHDASGRVLRPSPPCHAWPRTVEGPVSRNGQPACQGMSAGPSAWGDASN